MNRADDATGPGGDGMRPSMPSGNADTRRARRSPRFAAELAAAGVAAGRGSAAGRTVDPSPR